MPMLTEICMFKCPQTSSEHSFWSKWLFASSVLKYWNNVSFRTRKNAWVHSWAWRLGPRNGLSAETWCVAGHHAQEQAALCLQPPRVTGHDAQERASSAWHWHLAGHDAQECVIFRLQVHTLLSMMPRNLASHAQALPAKPLIPQKWILKPQSLKKTFKMDS